LSFQRFSAKEYLVGELFFKLLISHSNENVVIAGLRLHRKLRLSSISSCIEATCVERKFLLLSIRACLPLRVGR
jgi:hypothetical protein